MILIVVEVHITVNKGWRSALHWLLQLVSVIYWHPYLDLFFIQQFHDLFEFFYIIKVFIFVYMATGLLLVTTGMFTV